ncbi:uncharacterized protein N7515_008386 [Penicillium bovifimosum]|uniref:HTH CENPB-type domain-containing protein n=1 Tax=Penicillium bovifimosum TaxID=126998 RepID=A0A9W9GMX8_9EURO|nr:uncharacterized protein N7515_008386 [Penicillium bovifimosum]KAJ5124561.1 hypothetical protein N7515_008386 [Penicillium bovifimosum]
MPPIRSQGSRNLTGHESRISLAIQAFKNEENATLSEVARRFDIPRSTLCGRLSSSTERAAGRAKHKLTEIEEETLRKWIVSLDDRGAAPRFTTIREIANMLLAARGTTPVQTVGEKWAYNFVKRHPELSQRLSRRANPERATRDVLRIIGEWFALVQKTRLENDIDPDDIYNFAEIGFALGSTEPMVATRSGYCGYYDQPSLSRCEWVTAIECTNASGWALPPCVVHKGRDITKSGLACVPEDWRVEISPNGWTSDEINLRWLEKLFIPSTTSRVKGRIGCFANLERSYDRVVDYKLGRGITQYTQYPKVDFIMSYPLSRDVTFKPETIKNSFAAAGLVPFSPDRVLSKLKDRIRTLTLPRSGGNESSRHSTPETPSTENELRQEASPISARVRTASSSPRSLSDDAMNQAFEGHHRVIEGVTNLAKENRDLRAALQRERQKRWSNKEFAWEGGITGEKYRELLAQGVICPKSP